MLMLPDYRVRQRDYLLEISRAMTSELDLDEVLRLILSAAVAMLGGEVGLIALREGDHTFRARATAGVDPDRLSVFAPLLENLNQDDGLEASRLDLRMRLVARALDIRLRQVVALPMIIRGSIVGVIFVFRTYAAESNPNDRVLLQSFADQAAIAVNNARLVQTITEGQRRTAAMVEHSADGVMVLDAEQRMVLFNRALGRITGWSAAEALGQFHDKVITWERIDQGQALGAALASGWPYRARGDGKSAPKDMPEPLYVEGDLARRDGTRVSLGVTYAALLDDEGRLLNIIANVRDITHFRRAEEAKSTFISVISHELKTPVAVIKGYASTLRRDDANWDHSIVRDGLAVIEEETDRLTELINNLLAASKLQAEGMRLSQVDAVDLVQLVLRSAERFQLQTKKHDLVIDFPDDFPHVMGDETRLRQVFDNLISNAIKYSPEGGNVRIVGSADEHNVTVAVSDQGVGIPQDEQAHIFERFYRVDDALSRRTQGTGLGLYLARAVIAAHGGAITVESQPGKGSTFRVTLPRDGAPHPYSA
ncbi:MAG: PAS domain S-box protein [Anaerolineae bacterium]|nr:PAS domain S-box protein [Anaerolineae bacterium]